MTCLFVVVVEVMFTRNSAFQMDEHGNGLEEDYSGVVIQKLYSNEFLSTGVIIFPPLAETEICATDIDDLVCSSYFKPILTISPYIHLPIVLLCHKRKGDLFD